MRRYQNIRDIVEDKSKKRKVQAKINDHPCKDFFPFDVLFHVSNALHIESLMCLKNDDQEFRLYLFLSIKAYFHFELICLFPIIEYQVFLPNKIIYIQ